MSTPAFYICCAIAGSLIAAWSMPVLPRYLLLLAIAAVPQLGALSGVHSSWLTAVSGGALLLWGCLNWSVPGVRLITCGGLTNLLVMWLHGGAMPISADILARFGHTLAPGTLLPLSKDVVVDPSVHWLSLWLSDWIVVSVGAKALAISPGDVLVFVGVIWWLLRSAQHGKEHTHGVFRSSSAWRASKPRIARAESAAGSHAPGTAGPN